MRSVVAGSHHVRTKHTEAAEQQNDASSYWDIGNQIRRNTGEQDDRKDRQRQRAVVDEQSDQLATGCGQRLHGTASGLGRRARTTAASATARNSAANATIARSAPGQATPSPSPVQNMPNADSITPTANLSVFSGTRASGR